MPIHLNADCLLHLNADCLLKQKKPLLHDIAVSGSVKLSLAPTIINCKNCSHNTFLLLFARLTNIKPVGNYYKMRKCTNNVILIHKHIHAHVWTISNSKNSQSNIHLFLSKTVDKNPYTASFQNCTQKSIHGCHFFVSWENKKICTW